MRDSPLSCGRIQRSLNRAAPDLLDLSNGYLVNDVFVWISSQSVAWHVDGLGAQYKYSASSNDVLREHMAAHPVPDHPNFPSLLANLACYVNGVQQGSAVSGILPDYVARSQALFGQPPTQLVNGTATTLTPAVAQYNGYVDMIAIYNTSLPLEAVQAHSLLVRPPVFEVYFPVNPQVITGVVPGSYTWLNVDPADGVAVQALHSGLVSLDGTASQYIDLTTYSGPRSVGTTLPTIGGPGSGALSTTFNGLSTGFTVELAVKVESGCNSSRVWSTGSGPGLNEVYLAYDATSSSLRFVGVD